jgi:AraC-like DNA-binding protein
MMAPMQKLLRCPATKNAGVDGAILVLGPDVALTTAPTKGVAFFARCPPVHSVLLGQCRVDLHGTSRQGSGLAIPAHTPHAVQAMAGPQGGVVYLDPRRYRFEDAQRLAERWRDFVPGRDDLREALGDALFAPRRRIDARLLRALEALDQDHADIPSAARSVGLSESRLTHLMTDTLGAPPRAWRSWLRLRRALHEALLEGCNLTQAAHSAGFVDSAHLTRTSKLLTGVAPSRVLPRTVYVARPTGECAQISR